MNKIRIGKVAITHEGIYDDKKTYEVNTCVSYNGSTYISLKQVKNVIPSNDGVYWRLMASKGDKGEKGNDGSVSFNSLTESQKKQLKGEKGNDGYYFIPEMDEQGNLSWKNNGGLENPETINLKGPPGPKGAPGDMFYLQLEDDGHLYLYDQLGSLSNLFDQIGEDGHLYLNIE